MLHSLSISALVSAIHCPLHPLTRAERVANLAPFRRVGGLWCTSAKGDLLVVSWAKTVTLCHGLPRPGKWLSEDMLAWHAVTLHLTVV